MKTVTNERRVFIGVIFFLLGAFSLLNLLGWIPYFFPDYLFSWKSLFILAGSFALSNRENKTPGIVLISIGLYFLFKDIFDLTISDLKLFWPLVLMVIGLLLIFRNRFNAAPHTFKSRESSVDLVDETAIFSGIHKRVTSANFRGGTVTSVFGGVEINLRDAILSDSNNVIDVTTVFGGVTLIVPPHWVVKSDIFVLFGGFEHERRRIHEPVLENTQVLHIKGFILFGGGEVKTY